MTRFLYARQIRIFGYPEFAVTLRDEVREAAASLAAEAGVAIEHVAKSRVRKEAIVPGCWRGVAIIPAWCMSSRRWKEFRDQFRARARTRVLVRQFLFLVERLPTGDGDDGRSRA